VPSEILNKRKIKLQKVRKGFGGWFNLFQGEERRTDGSDKGEKQGNEKIEKDHRNPKRKWPKRKKGPQISTKRANEGDLDQARL